MTLAENIKPSDAISGNEPGESEVESHLSQNSLNAASTVRLANKARNLLGKYSFTKNSKSKQSEVPNSVKKSSESFTGVMKPDKFSSKHSLLSGDDDFLDELDVDFISASYERNKNVPKNNTMSLNESSSAKLTTAKIINTGIETNKSRDKVSLTNNIIENIDRHYDHTSKQTSNSNKKPISKIASKLQKFSYVDPDDPDNQPSLSTCDAAAPTQPITTNKTRYSFQLNAGGPTQSKSLSSKDSDNIFDKYCSSQELDDLEF